MARYLNAYGVNPGLRFLGPSGQALRAAENHAKHIQTLGYAFLATSGHGVKTPKLLGTV